MATPIALKSLATGTVWDLSGDALSGRQVYVYARDTTTQVTVFRDSGLVTPYTQPLITGVDGTPGAIPGYVASGQSIDFLDVQSNLRTQAEALSATAIISGSSGIAVQGAGGVNLGATATINFASIAQEIWLVGTLNANLTVTLTNRVAGCRALILCTQDGTGARSLTLSDGTGTKAIPVAPAAGALSVVELRCPDATTIDVAITGGGGAVEAQVWLGLNGNSVAGYGSLTFWPALGFSIDRQEIVQPAAAPLANIATSLSNGVTNVVFPIEDSTFNTGVAFPTNGTTISNYAAYFVATVQAIENAYPGIGRYEIINESWFFYTGGQATATTYAAVVLAVLQAAQTAGLDLTRIYPLVRDQSWPAAMITAQPGLSALIKGWSIHPYGAPPPGYAQNTTQGIGAVPYFRDQLTVGQNNIIITEIGVWDYSVSAANSTAESTALTGALAQKWTQQIVAAASEMHEAGWLQALVWYSHNNSGWATNASGGALTNVGTALAQFPLDDEQFVTSGYSVQDDGWVAVTMDPYIATDAVQLTSGKVHLFRFRVDKRLFAQTLVVYLDTIGATLTSGQCFVGVYDLLGNLLSTSTDQAATFQGTTGAKAIAIASNNFRPGYYFGAIGANGTTMPKFRGTTVGLQAVMGAGSALPTRAMISVNSFTTALPSSIILTTGGAGGITSFGSGILVALSA